MAEKFEYRLRRQLMAGVAARRVRRRRLAVGGVVLVVAVSMASVAWLAQGDEADVVVSASSGTTTTDPRTQHDGPDGVPPVTNPVPGGPVLADGVGQQAIDLVAQFLDLLRDGDTAAAAELWTGYPTAAPGSTEQIVGLVAQFREDHGWLHADVSPQFSVSPSPSFGEASPIVTVVADLPGGGSRAAAFVVMDWSTPGSFLIERLPAVDVERVAPVEGEPVRPGQVVDVAAFPVEGGARAFIDGAEVTSTLDFEARSTSVAIPSDASDEVVVTLSIATPEVPDALAVAYPVAGP